MHEGVRLLHQTEMRRFGLTSPLPYCGAESLQDVTGRQWFARQWTIQEAAWPPKDMWHQKGSSSGTTRLVSLKNDVHSGLALILLSLPSLS